MNLADSQVAVDHTIQVVQVLSLLVGTLLPIAVAFVTKSSTSASTKAILLAAFAAVSAIITTYINDTDDFDFFAAFLTALTTFVVAVAMHFGLWKPTGVSASVQNVGVKDDGPRNSSV